MAASARAEELYAPGYPIFVDVRGRRVVVIGGGAVAQRKVETLLEYGAAVHVVAPEVTEVIRNLADTGTISLEERVWQPGDLHAAALAISACGVPEVDEAICMEAAAENCLVNVVDVPERCGFIVPSIVKRGPLQSAISTSGAAPTEAKNIRRQLEGDFDESWEPYMKLMGQVRLLVKERIAGGEPQRRPYYEAASLAGWRERLAAGEVIEVEDAYAEVCKRVEG
ncbi:MAG: bifunctional precorrin-2 dehydrogenase/sirohydrochlorin ferrochelatase [Eggerthellaceae bacterium]|nr:bifunctional precorrin-2 dehydrogenase/sirohydrochlorin ferrochelatase [Eggerthellaceae bacterium]